MADKASRWPNSLSVGFVEGLYAEYLRDPTAVPADWREIFAEMDQTEGQAPRRRLGPSFRPSSVFNPAGTATTNGAARHRDAEVASLQDRVDQLVRGFRVRGHLAAQVDPLNLNRPQLTELTPAFYGLTEADMERLVSSDTIPGEPVRTLGEVVEHLRTTYCRSIGVEFMHIHDVELRRWLQRRMERTQNRLQLERSEQLRIFTRLTDAVIFEDFIRTQYVGAKSFSLQGAESLIPLLDLAIEKAGEQGLDSIVLGMAHRGRLNVLANIMKKHPREIFREFEDRHPEEFVGRGDVKYHLGYSSDWETASGRTVHLSLAFNPSHLEFVNPVAMGRVRAKQDRAGDHERQRGMVLLIHGDAAFAGEGVVQETLNLSRLAGYATGGSLHVIVNNQIGFTTPPEQARSSPYASDVAKMLQSPVFHVNGEDPEAVAQVVRLAMDFRREFKRDVVIDMYCYRYHGHNEGDEPAFTQPRLYTAIRNREPVREGYLHHLLQLGRMTREEADRIAVDRKESLGQALNVVRDEEDYTPSVHVAAGIWRGYHGGPAADAEEPDTTVDIERLSKLLEAQAQVPGGFHPHPKIRRFLNSRKEMARGERPVDWTNGEALAFASVAVEGYRIRLSGQDSERGTFSQRHAVLHDVENGDAYAPLQHLADDQAPVEIYNSPLSENGVLGFEYGYSLDYPDALVAWEAQFGDFVNAAQVIVDQFITSAEEKWNRLSGIVLLLPHGFEGQGPEHSSARLERFLTLAAEDNIQVVYPTTPAQYYHLLRRQTLWRWRKPLVVMTPKSLLRHRLAVSKLEELAQGRFQQVIPDQQEQSGDQVKRILVCSGKIYYDLDERRAELERSDVAILRLEQLYPFPGQEMEQVLKDYAPDTPLVWVQEEPENMGAWPYLRLRIGEQLHGRRYTGIYRPKSSSPATGSGSSHSWEQEQLLKAAFAED